MDKVLDQISRLLKHVELRYKIHKFDSGAVMIDIWKDDLFYVIQIEDTGIGFSLVTENTGFDMIPDKLYDDFEKFKTDFEKIFEHEP